MAYEDQNLSCIYYLLPHIVLRCYSTTNAFFKHHQHIVIVEKLQFLTCFFERRIPSEAGRCEVMRWVKIVMFQTSFSKIFKHICEQENIRFEIEVVIIANSFTIEGVLNIESVFVISIRNIFIVQF